MCSFNSNEVELVEISTEDNLLHVLEDLADIVGIGGAGEVGKEVGRFGSFMWGRFLSLVYRLDKLFSLRERTLIKNLLLLCE